MIDKINRPFVIAVSLVTIPRNTTFYNYVHNKWANYVNKQSGRRIDLTAQLVEQKRLQRRRYSQVGLQKGDKVHIQCGLYKNDGNLGIKAITKRSSLVHRKHGINRALALILAFSQKPPFY